MKNYIKLSSFIFLLGFTLSLYSYAEKNISPTSYPVEAQFRLKIMLFKETIKQNLKKNIQSCKNIFLPK